MLVACKNNTWGVNCNETCQCVHGVCDPVLGTCACFDGYTGTYCRNGMLRCTVRLGLIIYIVMFRFYCLHWLVDEACFSADTMCVIEANCTALLVCEKELEGVGVGVEKEKIVVVLVVVGTSE